MCIITISVDQVQTIYGYQTARIWGWVFPQIVFIGGFLAYRQATAADKIYKYNIFFVEVISSVLITVWQGMDFV